MGGRRSPSSSPVPSSSTTGPPSSSTSSTTAIQTEYNPQAAQPGEWIWTGYWAFGSLPPAEVLDGIGVGVGQHKKKKPPSGVRPFTDKFQVVKDAKDVIVPSSLMMSDEDDGENGGDGDNRNGSGGINSDNVGQDESDTEKVIKVENVESTENATKKETKNTANINESKDKGGTAIQKNTGDNNNITKLGDEHTNEHTNENKKKVSSLKSENDMKVDVKPKEEDNDKDTGTNKTQIDTAVDNINIDDSLNQKKQIKNDSNDAEMIDVTLDTMSKKKESENERNNYIWEWCCLQRSNQRGWYGRSGYFESRLKCFSDSTQKGNKKFAIRINRFES